MVNILFALNVLIALLVFVNSQKIYPNELVLKDPKEVGQIVISPQPHHYLKEDQLPTEWDYRKFGLLTEDLNQHIPVYCGSCWAHSALSSIADRIKIATKGKQRDIIPSVQVLINCGDAGSCNGGDSNAANAWIYKNGIPDTTCQQYQAKNMKCTRINTCMTCDPTHGCIPITEYPKISISEYGSVSGEHEMMAEIYARGPISVYLNSNCLHEYTGGVNMYDTCDNKETNHAIQLNGWGTENGTDYWIGRNSWGTYWVRGGRFDPGEGYWAVPDLSAIKA
eukprot:gene8953-18524_t